MRIMINNIHVNVLLLSVILMTRNPPFYDNHSCSAYVSPQNNCCIPQSMLCNWARCLGDTNMQGLACIRLYDVSALIVRKISPSLYLVSLIDRLVQERYNSSALAIELRLSCTNPSICAQWTCHVISGVENWQSSVCCHVTFKTNVHLVVV